MIASTDCHYHGPYLQDVGTWSYKELQSFCKYHSLKANGNTAELRERINSAFCENAVVDVMSKTFPATYRRGVITQLLNE